MSEDMKKDVEIGKVEWVTYSKVDRGAASHMPYRKVVGNKIRAYHFPFCCTGIILAQLGGSDNEYNGNRASREELTKQIQFWIDYFTVDGGYDEQKQFISVCTADEQKRANEVLESLGFTNGAWVENYKYEDTELTTWTLPIGHLNKQRRGL